MGAVAFLVLYIVLGRPFYCRVLVMTHLRSDEYGEGPKGPASTGEEAEMGFEAR